MMLQPHWVIASAHLTNLSYSPMFKMVDVRLMKGFAFWNLCKAVLDDAVRWISQGMSI